MKFSYNWIADMVEGLDTPPADLMRLITMKTAECEGLEAVGVPMDRACAARIVSIEPIEGSTHNRKAVVETLAYGMRTVVCGAPNCHVDLVTAYLPLPPKEIEGVVSDGMLASPAELGLTRDHTGLMEWTSDARLSPDNIIEVDNKSLTHRPDLWGHFGMAREVAAILHKALRDPVSPVSFPHARSPVQIEIPDLTLCPRYSALVFDNVKVGPSPLWLQYRLEAIGLNPINNVVDVTNYVMSEIGQPMHAFDGAKLRGSTIYARPAKGAEHITALNEESYKLSPANLVIADETGPIAIAGVIGGLESAIDNGTRRVVLESACFQAASVRRTSSMLKLRTDASMRFEKAQDPANTVRGLMRALELLSNVSPGIRMVGGLADRHAEFKTPPPIDLPLHWLQRKLGRPIDERQVRDILESLGFKVNGTSVSVPTWRATKDISIKDDLLEEVGRMIGYDSITPTAPLVASAVPPSDPRRTYLRHLKQVVADQGFTEVHNYSFISEEMAGKFGLEPAAHVRVENPISSDQTLMRISLLPGIWKNVLENSKHLNSFRLFEVGREIHKKSGGELPDEIPHLVAALYSRDDGAAGLFEIKRLAECFMPGCQVKPVDARPYEHPERSAEIEWRGEKLGRIFEFHPSLEVEGRAAVLEVDLARAEKLDELPKRYQPFRRFPTSAFDLSVMAGLREPVAKIENRLCDLAAADLVSIEFVRQYSGAPLPPDRKSISYRVTVGASDRTLSSDEVGVVRARLIEGLQSDGYELRL